MSSRAHLETLRALPDDLLLEVFLSGYASGFASVADGIDGLTTRDAVASASAAATRLYADPLQRETVLTSLRTHGMGVQRMRNIQP